MKQHQSLMNKRGWIRVVEAFVAVLLIAGIILSLLGSGYIKKEDASPKIYEIEVSILRDIQNNNTLRDSISNAPASLPINWTSTDFPIAVKNKIQYDPPNYLICEGKICSVEDPCLANEDIGKDVFARSTIISSSNTKQLKIFCWEK